jgi:hypothetical protein
MLQGAAQNCYVPQIPAIYGFDAEPVIGPRFARTRWHHPI